MTALIETPVNLRCTYMYVTVGAELSPTFKELLCNCLTLFQVLQTLILPFHYCTHSERIDK